MYIIFYLIHKYYKNKIIKIKFHIIYLKLQI